MDIPENSVWRVPGYLEAVQRERLVRESAYLGLCEDIQGFTVLPLTLEKLMLLRSIRSPLLSDSTPTPEELSIFLWVLSPEFTQSKRSFGKWLFFRRCRNAFVAPPKTLLDVILKRKETADVTIRATMAISAARSYIDEAFQDRPPSKGNASLETDYFCDAAQICVMMGKECGFSRDETMKAPLKQLFQELKVLSIIKGQKVLFNPSDKVLVEATKK